MQINFLKIKFIYFTKTNKLIETDFCKRKRKKEKKVMSKYYINILDFTQIQQVHIEKGA